MVAGLGCGLLWFERILLSVLVLFVPNFPPSLYQFSTLANTIPTQFPMIIGIIG